MALALLAIMLAAIGSLVAASRKATRTIEDHVALVETARLVSTTATQRDAIQFGDLTGEVSGHRWRATVSPLAVAVSPVDGSGWIPRSIIVQVQSPSGALFSLETVRLQKLQTRSSQ